MSVIPKRKCSSVDSSLGQNLVFFRKAVGWTQQQIADMLNINRTTYTKYELGTSEPSLEILKKIASILNVDMNTLLDENAISAFYDIESVGETFELSSEEIRLIALFRQLETEEKESLLYQLSVSLEEEEE